MYNKSAHYTHSSKWLSLKLKFEVNCSFEHPTLVAERIFYTYMTIHLFSLMAPCPFPSFY